MFTLGLCLLLLVATASAGRLLASLVRVPTSREERRQQRHRAYAGSSPNVRVPDDEASLTA